eukprot:CAMPEP_0202726178 /NCGR_PEP_ID=MMETSP1385-20130828/184475_1 /ASSEMBLY_ACC=CAM_ASM_000861 /TAXON_ID=933848 /ORGANISM="Elphidium margaritaceum" /LENGTH=1418 /DNA_ID=CAMNT_0049392391 /DNA_START=59 /DNA_END=4317 /DNA_ORIENTATION=+
MPSESNTLLESYTFSQISSLSRKELQTLCKSNGIKANSKNTILVQSLQRKLTLLHDAKRRATGASKENKSSSANQSPTSSITSSVNRTRTKLRRKSAKFTNSTERTGAKAKANASTSKSQTPKTSKSVSVSACAAPDAIATESAPMPAANANSALLSSECDEQITNEHVSKADCDDQAAAAVATAADQCGTKHDENQTDISCYYDSDIDLNESCNTHNNNGSLINMSDVEVREPSKQASFTLLGLQHDGMGASGASDLNESCNTHNNNGSLINMSDVEVREPSKQASFTLLGLQHDGMGASGASAQEPITSADNVVRADYIQSGTESQGQSHDAGGAALSEQTTESKPTIVPNDVDMATNDADDEEDVPNDVDMATNDADDEEEEEEEEEVVNETSLSVEQTPKLDESTELFIRSSLSKNQSLQPKPQHRRTMALDALQLSKIDSEIAACDDDDDDDDEDEDDDVDMVTTPAMPDKRDGAQQPAFSLQQEIGSSVASVRRQQRRQHTPIVPNDVDMATNDADDEEEEVVNETSLSVEQTPKLDESTELFIRSSLSKNQSLQPKPQHRRTMALDALQLSKIDSEIAACDDDDDDEDEDDDVDMVTTPAMPEKRDAAQQPAFSLQQEIGSSVASVRRQQRRQHTPLLNMNASRITVDSNDKNDEDEEEEEEEEQEEEDEDDEMALSVKAQPETPTKSEDDFRVTAIPIVSEENRELLATATELNDKTTTTMTEIDAETPKPLHRLVVKPKSELKLKDDSTSISMTFGDGQRFEFKSIYSPSQSRSVSKMHHTLSSDDNDNDDLDDFGDGQRFEFKSIYSPSQSRSVSKMHHTLSSDDNDNDNDDPHQQQQQPQQHWHNKSRPSKEIGKTPQEILSEKTMAIRQMMEEAERELTSPLHTAKTINFTSTNNKNALGTMKATSVSLLAPARNDNQPQQSPTHKNEQQKRRKSMDVRTVKSSSTHKKGMVPDWNAIHQKQIFSREPNIKQWDEARKARTERMYGRGGGGGGVSHSKSKSDTNQNKNKNNNESLASNKMSTPGLRHRSMKKKNPRGTHTLNSDQKMNRKRVTIMPSSNDHKFNQSKDSKLNRKVQRAPTPYKHTDHENGIKSNQKVSVKPRFSMTLSEEAPAEEEEEEQQQQEQEVQADEKQEAQQVSTVPTQQPDGDANANKNAAANVDDADADTNADADVDVQTQAPLNIETDANKNVPTNDEPSKTIIDSSTSTKQDGGDADAVDVQKCAVNANTDIVDDEKPKHTDTEKEKEKEKPKVPRKKLAFDPTKVRSKLFDATKASNNKSIPKNRRLSQTPQIESSVKSKKSIAHTKMVRNWSAVKSKVDTGRTKLKPKPLEAPTEEATQIAREVVHEIETSVTSSITRVAGIKRKLTWAPSDSNHQSKDELNAAQEPQQKKRRMSQQPVSNKRWQ